MLKIESFGENFYMGFFFKAIHEITHTENTSFMSCEFHRLSSFSIRLKISRKSIYMAFVFHQVSKINDKMVEKCILEVLDLLSMWISSKFLEMLIAQLICEKKTTGNHLAYCDAQIWEQTCMMAWLYWLRWNPLVKMFIYFKIIGL